MPFPVLPTALGLCFALVWAFIGAMIMRDSQLAARRDRDSDDLILPLTPPRPKLPPARSSAAIVRRRRRQSRRRQIRIAS